jgi:hypothetical protein
MLLYKLEYNTLYIYIMRLNMKSLIKDKQL